MKAKGGTKLEKRKSKRGKMRRLMDINEEKVGKAKEGEDSKMESNCRREKKIN